MPLSAKPEENQHHFIKDDLAAFGVFREMRTLGAGDYSTSMLFRFDEYD
jgi:hypothetical protein